MLQFKRFFVFIYLHLTLSVMLTYLTPLVVFQADFLSDDIQKSLFGLVCVSLIYLVIGAFWGSISPEKKKLWLPLGLYVLVLLGLFVTGFTGSNRWFVFLNGNIPYTYFIRNVASRTPITQLIDGLSCVLPSLALFNGFQIAHRLTHRRQNFTESQ